MLLITTPPVDWLKASRITSRIAQKAADLFGAPVEKEYTVKALNFTQKLIA